MGVAPTPTTVLVVPARASSSGHPFARTLNGWSQHGLCQEHGGRWAWHANSGWGVAGENNSAILQCRMSGALAFSKMERCNNHHCCPTIKASVLINHHHHEWYGDKRGIKEEEMLMATSHRLSHSYIACKHWTYCTPPCPLPAYCVLRQKYHTAASSAGSRTNPK